MPIRRCSGLSTRNSPPRLQKAWPPRLCSPSWSSSSTLRPASATSAAATSPASPAPTTMTSASTGRESRDGQTSGSLERELDLSLRHVRGGEPYPDLGAERDVGGRHH